MAPRPKSPHTASTQQAEAVWLQLVDEFLSLHGISRTIHCLGAHAMTMGMLFSLYGMTLIPQARVLEMPQKPKRMAILALT